MGPTRNTGYMLQHLSSVLAKQSDQALRERLGIGLSQLKILWALEGSPNPYAARLQQKEIAECLGQTEASISRQIKLMHEKGLLQTTINPTNKRDHLTAPTAKGLRISEEAMDILNNYHAPMFEDLGEKKQQQLLEIFTQMHKLSCQPGKTGACHRPFSVE
ncbi:MAG: MarR family winged helix-turn-helix transcriptional regulator [Patescibacteria group bacterium]